MKYYCAVDIGASSGRLMLAHLQDGKIILEEAYRFSNGIERRNGHLCWDLEYLFQEIKAGLKKCMVMGKPPEIMGIDTWAVDFVLLDGEDQLIGDTVAYRDGRTAGMDREVSRYIELSELYSRTGIQKLSFNTIYQLMAVKQENPEDLEKAKAFLMIPDYLNFLLTGVKKQEYTNATSTQLVNAHSKNWDIELIERLGLNKELFGEISTPGTMVGRFSDAIRQELGFDCTVILPATHDTGSAVLAMPEDNENGIYISSGTWSLMGIESTEANCSPESMKANFTNEGGFGYRFRYLKNIMGLWMIQSVRKEWREKISFADIERQAAEARIESRVDCNGDCYLAPDSMIEAIQEECRQTGQQIPESMGEIARVIYYSLAKCYADTASALERLSGKELNRIYIVGGGSNDGFLNRLTAEATGLEVWAGPTEATALGNLMVQMIYDGQFASLSEARRCIGKSFEIKKDAQGKTDSQE